MIKSKMNDILTVLAVGIFADKKIHASEIQVFIRSVSRLALSIHEIQKISEAEALLWFEMNKDDISDVFKGPQSEFDAWLVPILKRVGTYADKEALLHLLNMISLADNEVHISEAALMALIKRVWGLD